MSAPATAQANVGQQGEDFVLVPRVPTEAMLRGGAAAQNDFTSKKGLYPRTQAVWHAMLASVDMPAAVTAHFEPAAEIGGYRAALQAQEDAEDGRETCVYCDGEGQWEHCPSCSLTFGRAIDLRRSILTSAPASPAPASNGWQPIETAPRDGSAILIYQPGSGARSRGHRECHMPEGALLEGECSYQYDDPRLQWYDDRRYAIGYWRPWGGWGNRNSAKVEPTHWQPLPEPPQVSA